MLRETIKPGVNSFCKITSTKKKKSDTERWCFDILDVLFATLFLSTVAHENHLPIHPTRLMAPNSFPCLKSCTTNLGITHSVSLLLAVLEGQSEVRSLLLPGWMKLGLSRVLINLLAFEMSKLMGERQPERYFVTDLILRTTEALSVIDGYSQELCSNKELFHLLIYLIKLPDKIEIANCCVTAAILIANMLTDAADLLLEISQDLFFIQGLLDLFPFASDDVEARRALWSIISRLLVQVEEAEISPSRLHQLVSVLLSKSDLIEEELFDHELDDSNVNHESSTARAELYTITTALSRIFSLLKQWKTLNDHDEKSYYGGKLCR